MSSETPEGTGHPVVAAVSDWFEHDDTGGLLADHRRYLVADLRGTVLDLGTGVGAMYPYFAEAATDRLGDRVVLHGIDPDPHARRRARRRADRVGVDIEVRPDRAESLQYADASFDRVVASLVFCTIPDVPQALREVARVLKPDGELRFLDHVRAPGARGHVQDAVTPLWKHVAAGCHLNRRTEQAVAESPLDVTDLAVVDGTFLSHPLVRGTAAPPH